MIELTTPTLYIDDHSNKCYDHFDTSYDTKLAEITKDAITLRNIIELNNWET